MHGKSGPSPGCCANDGRRGDVNGFDPVHARLGDRWLNPLCLTLDADLLGCWAKVKWFHPVSGGFGEGKVQTFGLAKKLDIENASLNYKDLQIDRHLSRQQVRS